MDAMDDHELPGYTLMSETQEVSEISASQSNRRPLVHEPHEHVNSLLNGDGHAWMLLHLLSDAPAGSKFPIYFNGSSIRGSAQIDYLYNPQTIHSVVVEVGMLLIQVSCTNV